MRAWVAAVGRWPQTDCWSVTRPCWRTWRGAIADGAGVISDFRVMADQRDLGIGQCLRAGPDDAVTPGHDDQSGPDATASRASPHRDRPGWSQETPDPSRLPRRPSQHHWWKPPASRTWVPLTTIAADGMAVTHRVRSRPPATLSARASGRQGGRRCPDPVQYTVVVWGGTTRRTRYFTRFSPSPNSGYSLRAAGLSPQSSVAVGTVSRRTPRVPDDRGRWALTARPASRELDSPAG